MKLSVQSICCNLEVTALALTVMALSRASLVSAAIISNELKTPQETIDSIMDNPEYDYADDSVSESDNAVDKEVLRYVFTQKMGLKEPPPPAPSGLRVPTPILMEVEENNKYPRFHSLGDDYEDNNLQALTERIIILGKYGIMWQARLTLLHSLRLVYIDQNDEQFVKFDSFVKLIEANKSKNDTTKIRKENMKLQFENHKNGTAIIDNELHISSKSVLRYMFNNCDKLTFCDRVASQLTTVSTSRKEQYPCSSIKEVYNEVAKLEFKNTYLEQYLNDKTVFPETIPGLNLDYQQYYTEEEWKRICLFEWHFAKDTKFKLFENYHESVHKRWDFVDTLKQAKDVAEKCKAYAKTTIKVQEERKKIAQKEDLIYVVGSNGNYHDPCAIEQGLIECLQESNISEISKVFCIDCSNRCTHEQGIHLYFSVLSESSFQDINLEDVITITQSFLLNTHNALCSEIIICRDADVQPYCTETSKVHRFHLRDAIAKEDVCILKHVVLSHVGEPQDELDTNVEICGKCYPAPNFPVLHYKSFKTEYEWLLHVPLFVQLLLEAYINTTSLGKNNAKSYLPSKLSKLYFLHDSLLNVSNRTYHGLLQETNSYELIMGNKSVSTVFKISSGAGASMGLTITHVKLNERADKELCYFNTYLKHHEMEYVSTAGTGVGKVRMVDCPVKCLLLDNLVRLRFHADPKPGEHRTKQICTLPITVKGVPNDSKVMSEWHTRDCDETPDCSCKKDVQLSSASPSLLLESEQKAFDMFAKFVTWSILPIWKPLLEEEDFSRQFENIEVKETLNCPLVLDSTGVKRVLIPCDEDDLNMSFASLQLASDNDEFDTTSGSDISDSLDVSHLSTFETEPNYIEPDFDLPVEDTDETGTPFIENSQELEDLVDGVSLEAIPILEDDPEFNSFLHPSGINDSSTSLTEIASNILHKLSKDIIKERKHATNAKELSAVLEKMRFKKYEGPELLVRHPPPATGRDDDKGKLKEILDEFILKSGHDVKNGHRILFAPDHKIAVNMLALKKQYPEKYKSIILEFPILHLRKSKITNFCSAYKDLGGLHLLMYMRDTDDKDWAKLLETAHIEQATKYIRRLSMALHMAIMVTFVDSLPPAMKIRVTGNLSSGLEPDSDITTMYEQFIASRCKQNVIFAAHWEMMTHCDEIVALALSERIGGELGYNILLAIVKNALPFAFLTGSSSYAQFATQLLHEHEKCGPFCKQMKYCLYTGTHKSSNVNFGLDTQREIDHQDITRSFKSSSNISTVLPKMSTVDFLTELQTISNLHHADNEELHLPQESKLLSDILGLNMSNIDIAHIYRVSSLILRQGALEVEEDNNLVNVYGEGEHIRYPTALLDRDSFGVGRFLLMRCVAQKGLFNFSIDNLPNIEDYDGHPALKSKARLKSTTIRRTTVKLEDKNKTKHHLEEEKRQRKINRQKKEIDCLESSMNACQALVHPDGSKKGVNKAENIKEAVKELLSRTNTDGSAKQLIENGDIEDLRGHNITIAAVEFAGVKFRGNYNTGEEYVHHIENNIIQRYVKCFRNLREMTIIEEKYSFIPTLFKALTHDNRQSNKHSISINHLRPEDDIVSEVTLNKSAITQTQIGKEAISLYFPKHASSVNTLRKMTLNIDSELYLNKCTCLEAVCSCDSYARPLKCSFDESGTFVSADITNIRQSKGEGELALVDWLIECQPRLQPNESCISIVLSGDIDALVAHLFALSHLWPRDDSDDFMHPVLLMLSKPSCNDVYDVTSMIRSIEKYFGEKYFGMKLALFLCFGGNDFIPSIHRFNHMKILTKILANPKYSSDLVNLRFDQNKCVDVSINQELYLSLMRDLFCPRDLPPSVFLYDEIRQMSVQIPKKTKQSITNRNPKLWLPPQSASRQMSLLLQCQANYLMTVGYPNAKLPDVSSCFELIGDKVRYNFGPDAYVKSTEVLKMFNPHDLFKKISKHRPRKPKKRTAQSSPKKALNRKRPYNMSTPKKGRNNKRPNNKSTPKKK